MITRTRARIEVESALQLGKQFETVQQGQNNTENYYLSTTVY